MLGFELLLKDNDINDKRNDRMNLNQRKNIKNIGSRSELLLAFFENEKRICVYQRNAPKIFN